MNDSHLTNQILKNQEFSSNDLQKLTKFKRQQASLIAHYNALGSSKKDRCEMCSQTAWLLHQQHLESRDERLKLERTNCCKVRYCPICLWRRQAKFSKLLYQTLFQLQESQNLRFLFLTLTVRNPPLEDLRSTIRKMQKAFDRLSKRKRFKNSILGFCRVFEITKPKKAKQAGNVHPHFHVLLAVKPDYFNGRGNQYIPIREWVKLWREALQVDYDPVCDVRVVKPYSETKSAFISAVSEMVKYPLKDVDLANFSSDEFGVLDEQMRGVRTINFGGWMRQAQDVEVDEVELDDQEDQELWQTIARYLAKYDFDHQEYSLSEASNPD